MQRKTFKELYLPLFTLKTERGVYRHIEYLVNYVVHFYGRKRSVAILAVLQNIDYFLGNPYRLKKKRLRLLQQICNNMGKKLMNRYP